MVLGLSQDGACIELFENHSENSLKEDLLNVTTFNPPLFSLVNTFNAIILLDATFYFPDVPWVDWVDPGFRPHLPLNQTAIPRDTCKTCIFSGVLKFLLKSTVASIL